MSIKNTDKIIAYTNKIIVVTGAVAVLISILLIMNYIQIKTVSPIENSRVEKLIIMLNKGDALTEDMKAEIRTLDLMSRKAYFTSQWQFRTGALLLVFLTAALLVAFIVNRHFTRQKIQFLDSEKISISQVRANERFWIILVVMFIIVTSFLFAVLSDKEYSDFEVNNKSKEAIPDVKKDTAEPKKLTPDTVLQATNSDSIKVDESSIADSENSDANFPCFRGPGGLGISYAKNIPVSWDISTGKNLRWKTAIPLSGLNSPVIWGEYVFVAGAVGKKKEVYSLSLKSGKIVWTYSVGNVKGSPAAAPKTTDDTGLSASTVAVDGNSVFAIFGDGDLVAVDFNGKLKWAKNMGVPNNHYGHSSSLICSDEKLFVQFDDNKQRKITALSCKTGEQVWATVRPGRISWSSPIIVKNEIILNNEPFVASYDIKTGKENWKVECLSGEIGASPAYAGGLVFAANAYAKLAAIKPGTSPAVVWENNDYLPDVSSPVAWKNMLFISSSSGELAAYNISDGKLLWMHEFEDTFYSSPVIAEGRIYFADRSGNVHIMKADSKFELLSQNSIGEKTDCTPAFSNGVVVIRGVKHLFCFGK